MYTYDTRVTMSCAGPDGRQTPVSVVTMMQNCSMFWMGTEPALVGFLRENDAALMVASRQVDFYRFPRFGEKLQARTWIYKMHPMMGYRNTVLADENGELTAACWAIGVYVGYRTGKMLALPQGVIDSIVMDPRLDMEYLRRKVVLPKVEPEALPAFHARRSDIDFNRHVNNAQYVRMAYDLLPDGFEVHRMRIMHEGQAREGERIIPKLFAEKDRLVYNLCDETDGVFATVEWS